MSRFTSPFQWRGADSPNCPSRCSSQRCICTNPCKHSHRNRNVHVRGSLIVAVFLFSLCSLNVHGELAMHFFTSSRPLYFFFPPLFPFSLIVILSAFVSGWLFLLPSSFYSHFLTPAPIPPSLPLVFYLTSPLPVVLVGALVCHEGDGS